VIKEMRKKFSMAGLDKEGMVTMKREALQLCVVSGTTLSTESRSQPVTPSQRQVTSCEDSEEGIKAKDPPSGC
jgi:hypothetical protein